MSTSLLTVILFPLAGVLDSKKTFALFGNEVVYVQRFVKAIFLRERNWVDEALALRKQEKIDLVMVTRRKHSRLPRFLFGSAVTDLMMQAPGSVKSIDEE